MTDSTTVTAWMDDYRRAWASNDPDDIRALFTDDGEYRFAPYEQPHVGHDAILAAWLDSRDEPDTYTFTWFERGLDGDTAFVEGDTDYGEGRRYANLWVIRFAADGRASSFTEWYMRHPAPGD